MRYLLLEMGAEEKADSLDEEEVAIVIEIAEVIDRGRKDLPSLRPVPKRKLPSQQILVPRTSQGRPPPTSSGRPLNILFDRPGDVSI